MNESFFGRSQIICYDYDDFSIRLWFRNREVVEYTVEDVGISVLDSMKRLADMGRGLDNYLAKSKVILSATPRRWRE